MVALVSAVLPDPDAPVRLTVSGSDTPTGPLSRSMRATLTAILATTIALPQHQAGEPPWTELVADHDVVVVPPRFATWSALADVAIRSGVPVSRRPWGSGRTDRRRVTGWLTTGTDAAAIADGLARLAGDHGVVDHVVSSLGRRQSTLEDPRRRQSWRFTARPRPAAAAHRRSPPVTDATGHSHYSVAQRIRHPRRGGALSSAADWRPWERRGRGRWLITSGPPELPGLMAASVCIASMTVLARLRRLASPVRTGRSSALTMPLVTVPCRPSGEPIATTVSPARGRRESPSVAGLQAGRRPWRGSPRGR